MIDSDLDLLLLLLYVNNQEEIIGITRLEKLIFLLIQEKRFKKFQKEFGYIEYDYGPWSSQIIDNIEALSSYGLVEIEERSLPVFEKDYYQDDIELDLDLIREFYENKTLAYSLTPNGIKVSQELFASLIDKEKQVIQRIKNQFNKMPLRQLIRHVYHFYPEFTKKSIIKDKVQKLSLEEELRAVYPNVRINKKLLALVGSTPNIPIEDEKEYLRELIREKFLQ